MESTPVPRRSLGLPITTSIVLGNMVGSGVFLLPASLAVYGVYSIWGWGLSTAGALVLAWVFSNLARRLPKAGGPYTYPREAFGDFAGFIVAWIYTLGIIGTNAALAVAFASYMTVFFPQLATHPIYGAFAALGAIWILTAVNLWGVRAAGNVQLTTVILKLTPLIALAAFGIFHFDVHTFASGHTTETPGAAINACAALTMWAFLGLESATVPADHVRDPEKTIPRATLLGTIIAGAFYVICTSVVMGIIPSDSLAQSNAPFADAATLIWGSWAGRLIAAAAVISCFGTLNGWILLQGQFPQAVANTGLFPKHLARETRFGTPMLTLILGSAFASVLVLMSLGSSLHGGLGQTLVKMFNILILITTFFTLVPYMLCALAEIVLSRRHQRPGEFRIHEVALPILAFAFALWAAAGTGKDSLYWGTLFLLAGLPVYVWQKVRQPALG